jgi:HSP20 family protein
MELPVLRKNHHPQRSSGRSWRHDEEPQEHRVGGLTLREELAQLHERLDRLVGEALGDPGSPATWPGLGWRPPADVEETPDAYVVEVELPALKPEDVSVEVSPGELVVDGEIKERQRVGWLRTRTRRTGRFHYRLSLPEDIDPDAVSATLAEGVLNVRIPKAERARRRRIEVRT